ncbi:glycosyltransferase family 2 protein [Microbulbifer sp. JMSA004]|uniref:glycosyltransferase family 2 protein n=1 Tax=Microbulbifer sp. JMSA004 TaxID=3243370 RepID=UPI0040399745
MAPNIKIHVYLLCYNEEDIISNVLEYYSNICTRIFLLDNLSTDRSVELAKKFPKVTVISWQSSTGKIDEAKYIQLKTQLYKNYSRAGGRFTDEVADWVISCDMDEILYHPKLHDVLSEYKNMGVTVPEITGFDIVDEKPIDKDQSLLGQYKNGIRSPNFDKRIIFDCNFDMAYSYGCHPKGFGFEYMKRTLDYKSSNKYPIALLHYKHIGLRNYESALKNSERLDEQRLKKNENGLYQGLGSHYMNTVQSGSGYSPFIARAKLLFDDDGNIEFSDFPPSSGDLGIESLNISSFLEQSEVEVMGDTASAFLKINPLISFVLYKVLSRARPANEFYRKKLVDLKSEV